VVDVIRRLQDRGFYRDNKWLNMCHEAWFSYWVDYRTCLTMQDVNEQVKELVLPTEVDKPVFSEELEGETPLGGSMNLTAPWHDNDD